MGRYEERLYDYIMETVEENVEYYNQEAIDNNTNEYIDIDSLFERTFCYIIIKFLLDSHLELDDNSDDGFDDGFEIKLINDEGINSYDSIITGNYIFDKFNFKESFFVKILPIQYTQMFYKNIKFVELCIKKHILDLYIDFELGNDE